MNPVVKNRQARFSYAIEETFTAGIQLYGTEVKSIREGKANLSDSYCYLSEKGELWVKNFHISEFRLGTYSNHLPLRERKLLLKKNELKEKYPGAIVYGHKDFTNKKLCPSFDAKKEYEEKV